MMSEQAECEEGEVCEGCEMAKEVRWSVDEAWRMRTRSGTMRRLMESGVARKFEMMSDDARGGWSRGSTFVVSRKGGRGGVEDTYGYHSFQWRSVRREDGGEEDVLVVDAKSARLELRTSSAEKWDDSSFSTRASDEVSVLPM